MGRRSGITLLELLTVIVIFSMMLGLTVAILNGANEDLGVSAGANHAVALLRATQEQARSAGAPAWVLINPSQGSIRVLVKETVGEWHLEEGQGTGAFGRDAKITGGTGTPVPGRVGKGVQLGGSTQVSCGDVPFFEEGQGISVELWFQRRTRNSRGVLASAGALVEIAVEADGRISVKAGTSSFSSGQNRVPQDSWCRLQFVHSGREARLLLNGREAGRGTGTLFWPGPVPFTVGGQGFSGIVDEIRLGVVMPRNTYSLPGQCSFVLPPDAAAALPKEGDLVVAFDSEGRLDPPRELEFTIKSSSASAVVKIGPGGTIQR